MVSGCGGEKNKPLVATLTSDLEGLCVFLGAKGVVSGCGEEKNNPSSLP